MVAFTAIGFMYAERMAPRDLSLGELKKREKRGLSEWEVRCDTHTHTHTHTHADIQMETSNTYVGHVRHSCTGARAHTYARKHPVSCVMQHVDWAVRVDVNCLSICAVLCRRQR